MSHNIATSLILKSIYAVICAAAKFRHRDERFASKSLKPRWTGPIFRRTLDHDPPWYAAFKSWEILFKVWTVLFVMHFRFDYLLTNQHCRISQMIADLWSSFWSDLLNIMEIFIAITSSLTTYFDRAIFLAIAFVIYKLKHWRFWIRK